MSQGIVYANPNELRIGVSYFSRYMTGSEFSYPSPASFIRDSGLWCAWAFEFDDIAVAPRDSLVTLFRERGFDLEFWTGNDNLPPGVKWTGKYAAGHVDEDGEFETAELITGRFFDCGASAWRAAKDICPSDREPVVFVVADLSYSSLLCLEPFFGPPREIASEDRPKTTATILDPASESDNIGNCCSNCGLIGHNARTCSRPQKSHDKVGIEIEGRWETTRFNVLRPGLRGHMDGSLRRSRYRTDTQPWEFQTTPGSLSHALKQLTAYYPDETGPDCGLHVHISFPAADVAFFATEKFYRYFRSRWQAWGTRMGLAPDSEFFRRLVGKNTYCQPNHECYGSGQESMQNMTPVNMDRYAQINFASWSDHRTVEVRLLPMFRRRALAVSAVQEVVTIFEDYLNDLPQDLFPSEQVTLTAPNSAPVVVDEEIYVLEVTDLEFEEHMEIVEPPPVEPGFVRMAMTRLDPYIHYQDIALAA